MEGPKAIIETVHHHFNSGRFHSSEMAVVSLPYATLAKYIDKKAVGVTLSMDIKHKGLPGRWSLRKELVFK